MDDESRAWREEMLNEVRRAGRAAIAARAAAEACEESVERLEGGRADEARHMLEAILPACDALARMVETTGAKEANAPSWLTRLRRAERTEAELRALREAVLLLELQLTRSLEACGVHVDREVGAAVDPERHRVVETQAAPPGQPPGTVARVIRPGYRLGAQRLREADIVAFR